MSESASGGGGKGLIIGLACILVLPLGVVAGGAAILAGGDEQTASCAAPNNGQALAVVDGALPTVEGYTPEQVKLAAVILKTAEGNGLGSKAQLIGLITAEQESTLGADPSTHSPDSNHDAGPFQQRVVPGWYGTLEQVNDPSYGAEAFFMGHDISYAGPSSAGPPGYHIPGLVDIKGWEEMEPGDAAQAVQRSAYPSAYANRIEGAQRLMTALSGVAMNIDTPSAACSGGATDIAASGNAKTAIERGRGLMGTPYEFGGGGANGPDTGIDCSGFVQYMLAGVGINNLPRTAQGQFDALSGSPVDPKDIQPGDLIFSSQGRRGAVGSPDAISHVAMYAGNGKKIESTRYDGGTEPGVQEIDAGDIQQSRGFVGIRRIPGLSNDANNK